MTSPAQPIATDVRWSPVFAIAFSIAALITAELLPVSVLTPMASGLGVSEGLAGQSLTATAFAAIFSSLFVGGLVRRVDRRIVVMGFTVTMIVSSLLVAIAPNYTVLLLGRILLGIALGPFWAMAAALAMRLVPASLVPRALSIVFGGVSVSLVVAAPLGTVLGSALGWRGVFVVAAILAVACLIWQIVALPSMLPEDRRDGSGILAVAKRSGVATAMLAIFCVFAGQFAFFSYMRPFYEGVTGLSVPALSGVLLLFGICNFAGTSLSAPLLKSNLKLTLIGAPVALTACACLLGIFGHSPSLTVVVTGLWGFTFGFVPVAWSTWITTSVPDDAENAGGLQVAAIQVANTAGAAIGGYVLELSGPAAPVWIAAALLLATGVIALRVRVSPSAQEADRQVPVAVHP